MKFTKFRLVRHYWLGEGSGEGGGVGSTSDVCGVGVAYNVTYLMMHVIYQPPPPNRMTDACENITFPQLRLQAVYM